MILNEIFCIKERITVAPSERIASEVPQESHYGQEKRRGYLGQGQQSLGKVRIMKVLSSIVERGPKNLLL